MINNNPLDQLKQNSEFRGNLFNFLNQIERTIAEIYNNDKQTPSKYMMH